MRNLRLFLFTILSLILLLGTNSFATLESELQQQENPSLTPAIIERSPDSVIESGEVESSGIEKEVPIVLRGPASVQSVGSDNRARVVTLLNSKKLIAVSTSATWTIGEVLALESQTEDVGIIAFVSVEKIENNQDGTVQLTCTLLRHSRVHFVQSGDHLSHLDLSTKNTSYKGTTELIVKDAGSKGISSKYKPLFSQGVSVGETAQTLWEGEFLINFYGNLYYGVKDWLTVGSLIPANFFNAANVTAKARVYDSITNIASLGLNFANIPKTTQSTLNLNIYWDSVSSESSISHTLISIALFTFDNAENATAIKSLGTSSLQLGTEVILSNWDRLLLGPSFNLEAKAVGGYVGYVKIWDQFHISASLNTPDISNLKIDKEQYTNGYYILVDAYWRF